MTSLITDTSLNSLTAKYGYIQKQVEGQMEFLNKEAKDLKEINYVSFHDLEKNVDLMDWEQESSLRSLMGTKRLYYDIDKKTGKKTFRGGTKYIANTIMAHCINFEYARQMTHCGTTGSGTAYYTPCSKWKYCERCADNKRKAFFIKYAHVYACTSDPCYFITITMENKVNFVDGQRHKLIEDWDKMNTYVDLMYTRKILKGALVIEEAAFDSYYPHPVINPHLHIMAVGVDGLKNHNFEGMKIQVKPIHNQEHWVSELNYCHKAINFFHPYAYEWTPDRAETVNNNFRDMLENHKEIVKNRNQSRAIGIFHGKNKNAIVKTTQELKDELKEARKNKTTGQKGKKKIKCKDMFEEFSSGAKARIKQKKAADLAAAPVAKKEEETPWYKNPMILAGGGLALGAGAYGAGKLYNGGDNMINHTLGKGVDDYIVNPIKGLFNGEQPKQPPATSAIAPSAPAPVPSANSTPAAAVAPTAAAYKPGFSVSQQWAHDDQVFKPKFFGSYSNIKGISPLRPELQYDGLTADPSSDETNFIGTLARSYDTKENMAKTLATVRAGANGGRMQDVIPALYNKSDDELQNIVGATDTINQNLQRELSYDNIAKSFVAPQKGYEQPWHNTTGFLGAVNQIPGSLNTPYRDATRIGQVLAMPYDIASAGVGVASAVPGLSELGTKAIGQRATELIGKANPILAPMSAAIGSAGAGYNLGRDISEDPTNTAYKALSALGIDEKNMPSVTSGAMALGAGASNAAVMHPATRALVKRMVVSALSRAGVNGLAAGRVHPVLGATAAFTTAAAAPIIDGISDSWTKGMVNSLGEGDQLSTLYNNLTDAKTRMDTTGQAYALKGVLGSNYFNKLDVGDPAVVKQIYTSLGSNAGNVIMTAKKEGIMGLLSKKLNELYKNNKYQPTEDYTPVEFNGP